jgi:quinol-cytochrome oxidoreductase complex cytochrome b subunit
MAARAAHAGEERGTGMIVVLRAGSTEAEIGEVLEEIERRGIRGRLLRGGDQPLIHLTSGPTRSARRLIKLEQVEALVATSGPRVRREGRRFYPYYFVNLSAGFVVMLGLLVLLAGQLPSGIGAAIDAQHPPAEISVPWYARAPLALVALVPPARAWIGWLLVLAVAVAAFFLPALDRSKGSRAGERWPVLALGGVAAILWLWLTLAGGAR